jgi:hypothetical protein
MMTNLFRGSLASRSSRFKITFVGLASGGFGLNGMSVPS